MIDRDTLTEDAIWTQVQESLEDEVDGRAFEVAMETRLVAEYQDGLISQAAFEERLVGIQATLDADRQLRARTDDTSTRRRPNFRPAALAEMFALEAAELPDVAKFRARHLEHGLIKPENLAEWIADAAQADGEPTGFVTLPLTDDGRIAIDAEAIQDRSKLPAGSRIGHSIDILTYALPDETSVRALPVRLGGTLGALKQLADRLVRRYGWAEPHAVTFTLTGLTPPPGKARVKTNEPWPWRRARRSISIEVPASTPPSQVEQMYRDARSEVLTGERKPRSLSQRHAELAVFAFRHSQARSWPEIRQLWYDAHPKEPRASESNFRRDCRLAFRRVTGESLLEKGHTPDE